MKLVIGVAGERYAGKGTFVRTLEELVKPYSFGQISYEEILRNLLRFVFVKPPQNNFPKLATELERHYGKGTITATLRDRMLSCSFDVLVFNGLRFQADAEMIKENFSPHLLVYVTANVSLRWERSRQVGAKNAEEEVSFEQFLAEERSYAEGSVPELGAGPDFIKIVNEGTAENLRRKVVAFYERCVRKWLAGS